MVNNHSHTTEINYSRAFAWGISLNVIYIIIEASYGLMINSMSLIADAGHNLSDVLGLLLAWGAAYLARSTATSKRTYGFRKSTILAAMFNSLLLLIVVGGISIEAFRKFMHPHPIQGKTMMIVAGIGVVVNALTAFFFIKGKEKDINIKAAFMHMAADAGVSLGVVLGGLLIIYTGWIWVDPMISILILVVITFGTWGVLKKSLLLSIDAVPEHIDPEEVRIYLKNLPGVTNVHHIHIWAMSTTEYALTAHVNIPEPESNNNFLSDTAKGLNTKFGISHTTIQIENDKGQNGENHNCPTN
ncbi:MAG: cation diffusion facilitator family transporter [Ignavibacteriaceae bacterium]|nr:cation diffusion facilitator family transporter [Ignavibacteriaceae bacterium]